MSEPAKNPSANDAVDERIIALVRWKARSLVGRAGLTGQDCEDVAQELFARLVAPMRGYRPGPAARQFFARTLVDRFAANILRARRAAKRAGGPFQSLPADPPASDSAPDPLALDVAAAVEALPGHLRPVAELLKTETVAGAARALGVSRSTVYARVRELRGRAEFRKLAENPPASPDTFPANGEESSVGTE